MGSSLDLVLEGGNWDSVDMLLDLCFGWLNYVMELRGL